MQDQDVKYINVFHTLTKAKFTQDDSLRLLWGCKHVKSQAEKAVAWKLDFKTNIDH